MPSDALLTLQPTVTKTAAFNGTAVDLGTGTPPRGLLARVIYSSASVSALTGTAVFRITESDDNISFGGIYQPSEATVALSTTAASGEIYLPYATRKRYVRLELASITGTDATITYNGEHVAARDGYA